MNKHSMTLLTRASGAALLSSLLLSSPAHAGLLGGGSGSLGGGLNGGLTPRSLDIGGQANGSAQRDGTLLPRRPVQSGKEVGQRAAAQAAEARAGAAHAVHDRASTLHDRAVNSGAAAAGDAQLARDPAGGSATGSAQAAGMLSRNAVQPAAPSNGATPNGESGSPGAAPATRRADTSANAAARASRADRSISADASAQGSASR